MLVLNEKENDFLLNSRYQCNIIYGNGSIDNEFILLIKFIGFIGNEVPSGSLLCITSDTKSNLEKFIIRLTEMFTELQIKENPLRLFYKRKNIEIICLYDDTKKIKNFHGSKIVQGNYKHICGKVLSGWLGNNVNNYSDLFLKQVILRLRNYENIIPLGPMFLNYKSSNFDESFLEKIFVDPDNVKIWKNNI